ncbi:MAG: hypothetical protein GY696_33330 [Gammaproteobacteria bacterium]|nr:hypothetical protein [Gammaproteobacteria bacterium]
MHFKYAFKIRPFVLDRVDHNQFAYAPGRSTEDAVLLVQHFITCGFSSCPKTTKVAMVSFDVHKAFDQVLKNRLLLVLRQRFKVPDALASLIDSYLTGRMQTVSLGNAASEKKHVTSGMAQGSILGPHLFIAFITSVLNLQLSSGSKLVAFADDIVLLRPIASHLDCQFLQEDIDRIHQEYMNLHLLLNPAKTSYILCTLAPNPAEIFLHRTPELNGEPIERRPFLKYLGVIIDQKLNFGMHAELQAAKAKRAIGALWKVLGRWTSKRHFQEIYSKKIMPLLCYALPVSCPTTRKHWEIMEKVHRFACRLATNNFTA